jgi:apolipoprotein N-acyltransferase
MTAVQARGTVAGAQPPPHPPARRDRRGWLAWPAAGGAGVALLVSFPPYGLWWLAPVGVALLALATHRRRLLAGTLLGLLAGLVLFVPLLAWTGLHVGALPWLLLAFSQAAMLALVGLGAAWASPLVDRYRWCWPLVTGLLWVAQEALRDRVPFGGFPWGRLAFAQAGSPLLRLAALGGAPLVTFAVAVAGGLLALAAPGGRAAVRAAGLPGAVVVVLAGLLVPLSHPDGAAVTVAVVQGNVPRLGLDFNAQRRAVLDNHVRATLALAQQVRAGTARTPDLVVWPENASDIDPLIPADSDAYAEISDAARAIGAPILLGAVLVGPGDHARNTGIVWDPVSGPGATYVKQHPVPFAEYMPLRALARRVSSKADLVTTDFLAGHRPGVLRVGPATVGDVICFEVAYDNIVRDAVTGGGQLIVVQTNNATFTGAEARQQLAMVRLRAVEHGRDALMASTVGVSAFVGADGTVRDATGFNTQATLLGRVRLGGERTLASVLGPVPEWIMVAAALAVLLAAGRRRRAATAGRAGQRADTGAGQPVRSGGQQADAAPRQTGAGRATLE